MDIAESLRIKSKPRTKDDFDLKLMTHDPVNQEYSLFHKSTYVLIKENDKWDLKYFKIVNGEFKGWYHFVGGISNIKGLDAALAALPNKQVNLGLLPESDIEPIRRIIASYQHNILSVSFGKANGWELTDSINTVLLQFFNNFLKNDANPAFNDCTVLSKNTYMKCGPGVF